MPKENPKNSTSWEPVAHWYDKMLGNENTYQSKVILPNLLRILPPTKIDEKNQAKNIGTPQRIIDIACGQGFFSKIYAEGGAEVLGVDISPELIKRAKEQGEHGDTKSVAKNGAGNPQFEVASADKIKVAKDNYFDGALIVLALQNIKEMSETLKEASRVLSDGGKLVIVLNHPCFRILKSSSWGYDENNKVQYRRIDKYGSSFSVKVDMTPGITSEKNKVYTTSFHRPLQDYFKALAGAGLSVIGLEEWISHKQSEAGPRAQAEDTARKEFPMFLTIIARK